MIPSVGRIVHYQLNEHDVTAIKELPGPNNSVAVGDACAAVIVRVWGAGGESVMAPCNLKVLLDGLDTYWATSRVQGDGPGYWSEPRRV